MTFQFYPFLRMIIVALVVVNMTSCYAQDEYCASVERYNSTTHVQSSYSCVVHVSNHTLKQIDWINGGHSDSDDFGYPTIHENSTSFTDVKGVHYKITLLKQGADCFNDTGTKQRCRGTTIKGNRCKNMTADTSGRCWRHKIQ